MPEIRFRPFGMGDDEFTDLLILRDGVSSALREPLLTWIHLSVTTPYAYSGRYLNDALAHEIRGLSGLDLGARANVQVEGDQVMRQISALDDQSLLRLTDTLLYLLGFVNYPADVEHHFELASSKWTIDNVDARWRLIERLPAGVQDQIERTIESAGTAGGLLHRSFTHAYGLQSNPGEAYKMAVKAVETAAHPIIEPRNTGATLGTMLAVMRNAGTPWTLPLDERADHTGQNTSLIIRLAQSLWDGQEDRHRDGAVDIHEARAAFHAAATLVAWFSEDLITR